MEFNFNSLPCAKRMKIVFRHYKSGKGGVLPSAPTATPTATPTAAPTAIPTATPTDSIISSYDAAKILMSLTDKSDLRVKKLRGKRNNVGKCARDLLVNWNSIYSFVKQYVIEKGKFPTHNRKRPQIDEAAKWVAEQRRYFVNGTLSTEKKSLLDSIGMDWETRDKKIEREWRENFEGVRAFKENWGRFPDYKSQDNDERYLGFWIKRNNKYKN